MANDTRQTRQNDPNMPATSRDKNTTRDTNPDAITGTPGSHPVGTGIGAAAAGAAGAAIGSIVPGVGTVIGGAVGAVVGAVAGGLAGKGIAEAIDPTAEDAYWRKEHSRRPYATAGTSYDDYAPAYRYGWESRSKHQGKRFDEVESDLGSSWDNARGKSSLTWDNAKNASRDAWDRVDRNNPGQRDPM